MALPAVRPLVAGSARERKAMAGSRTDCEAGAEHLEDTDLLGRAEAVLLRAEDADGPVAVALECEHGIDEVLERLGSGQAAVLGDLADEDDGRARGAGEGRQASGRLPDLADRAGRPVEPIERHRLHRVDDEQGGREGQGRFDDALDIGLGEDVHRVRGRAVGQAKASGPQAELAGRLLARGVEHRALTAGDAGGGLEDERRLADAGLAAEQDDGAWHQPTAKDPVELIDARRSSFDVLVGERAQGTRLGWIGCDVRPAGAAGCVAHDRLDERVPGAAAATLTFPAQVARGAGLADVTALRPRHD